MADNFVQAALRHWNDAQLLEQQSRVQNADQLYGLAAECAIKSTLPPSSSDAHVNVLWGQLRRSLNSAASPELLAVIRGFSGAKKYNPFQDWNIAQRYGSDGEVSFQAMERHRNAASDVLSAITLLGRRKP